MLRLLMFDLDGTLVHTAPDIAEAANRALAAIGFEPRTMDEVIKGIGFGVNELMCQLTGEERGTERQVQAVQSFRDYYKDHLTDRSRPYPGAVEMLEGPLERFEKCVVTNKPHDLTEPILDDLGLKKFFPHWIGTGVGYEAKPHPEVVFEMLKRFNCRAEEAALIGDSDVDKDTAQAAEVRFYRVNYGYGGYNEPGALESAWEWRKIADEHV